MKVTDINIESNQIRESLPQFSLKSKYSLRFQNSKIEGDYRNAILSDIASTLGINYRKSVSRFMKTFYTVIVLYMSSYLSSYFEGKTYLRIFLFQAITLGVFLIVVSIIYYIYFIKNPTSILKRFFLISAYFIICMIIVINSALVRSRIFPDVADYGFTSILGILPLFYCSKFVIFSNFVKYFTVNLVLSASYLIIGIVSNVNSQKTVIEFFFLLCILLIESSSFYSQESLLRDRFITVKGALSPQDNKINSSSPKTDIEEISHAIKESIQLISTINQKDSQKTVFLERIFENLKKVMALLGNRNSIYSVDIEGLNKSFDKEDKIFLEETCIAPRRSQIMHSTKYLVRKTVEVLKNYEVEDLKGILKRIGKEWNFDMFFLKDCTSNKSLKTVGCFCMQKYHLDSHFSISQPVYEDYFTLMEDNYKPNPYHNSSHAADVLCSFLFIIHQSALTDYLQNYEILAIVIAMLGHDVAHPGVTNRFLINSKHPLATTYNDYSVLEMMHSSTTFQLMQEENSNILASISGQMNSMVRGLIIDMILATDMAKHFDLIGKFNAKLMNNSGLQLSDDDHRIDLLKIITKAADVAHAAKSQELHQRWTSLICEEFFRQGEMEKQKELPVSMYCDKEKTDIAKSQTGFIKNIVLPIYESLNSCLQSSEIKIMCINQLEANMQMWEHSVLRKRVMTLSLDSEENHTLKERTETSIARRSGRASVTALVFNG